MLLNPMYFTLKLRVICNISIHPSTICLLLLFFYNSTLSRQYGQLPDVVYHCLKQSKWNRWLQDKSKVCFFGNFFISLEIVGVSSSKHIIHLLFNLSTVDDKVNISIVFEALASNFVIFRALIRPLRMAITTLIADMHLKHKNITLTRGRVHNMFMLEKTLIML